MQSQQLDSVLAYRRIRGQYIQPVIGRVRIEELAGAQLLYGAHHALALHAAELALMYPDAVLGERPAVMTSGYSASVQHDTDLVAFFHIGGSGDDLDSLLTHIYLTDDELVRIGVLFDTEDLTRHYLREVLVQTPVLLYLCSGQRHSVSILLRRDIKLRNICLQPFI